MTKRFKKILGTIVFLTLPSLLFFGFLFFKYNEPLPEGAQGNDADNLAIKMLDALNDNAYHNTDYIEFTFENRHHYKWFKSDNTCEVHWDHFIVLLDLEEKDSSKVFVANNEYNGIEKQDYIKKGLSYFNNDTFWLVAPYKVFDPGVERRLVKTKDNKEALLVTYTSGGSTPGDSYLWHLDDFGKPKSFQMWTSILPIDGLEATWTNWITTESGAQMPTFHKLLFLGIEIGDVIGIQNKDELKKDDISSLDVIFMRTGMSSPIPIQDMYLRSLFESNDDRIHKKVITNRTFLNKFIKAYKKLKPLNQDGHFKDSRFSILVNYKSKDTDTLGLTEEGGIITINDSLYESSERLANILKKELLYYIKY
ncbi:hypothetical protein RM697_02400 [Ichthyenterobacterium sp. W332]|uniref:Uncharacterized protein n=1 Tax=Microcosmobacter mediterraneus TaxID=3075607 RepID=A0ABU2YH35_9FLAO|nr:hypothetical protein [Ichthyenterobacterium sp. W332]MDT0557481.1 hypothetical protein [Ichthyenterobacterium sp. W332]